MCQCDRASQQTTFKRRSLDRAGIETAQDETWLVVLNSRMHWNDGSMHQDLRSWIIAPPIERGDPPSPPSKGYGVSSLDQDNQSGLNPP